MIRMGKRPPATLANAGVSGVADFATPAPPIVGDVIPPFDYAALDRATAAKAKAAAAFISERQRSATSAVLEIGERLIEAKDALGHGHFTGWLHAEFGWTERTARNYMMAAKALPKTETVSALPVSTVYELARAPEPVRAKIIGEMEQRTVPAESVRDMIADAKRADAEARAEAAKSPEQRKRAKARRERDRRELEERQRQREAKLAAETEAEIKAVLLLRDMLSAKDLAKLVEALDATTWSGFAHQLRYPYGLDFMGRPNPAPAQK